MSEKQNEKVKAVIKHFGYEYVESYIKHFYPCAEMTNLTNIQAQKIITGLYRKLPRHPINNVYRYDVNSDI